MNSRALIVASLLAMTVATRALAEPAMAPFATLPAGSWAYTAVRDLSGAGYFTGYPGATFSDGRALTRFDFAVALQRMAGQAERRAAAARNGDPAAIERAEKEISELQRLASEFAPEYASLGEDAQQLARRLGALAERLAQHKSTAVPEAAGAEKVTPLSPSRLAGATRLFGRAADAPPSFSNAFGARDWQAGLLPPSASATPVPAGPLGLSLNILGPEGFSQPEARLPLRDPQASGALDARLSLPLGRTLVSGFYKRVGEEFQGDAVWMPAGYRGVRGLQGFGGGIRAPLGRIFSLDVQGGQLHQASSDSSGQVMFLHSGVNIALGRALTLDVGYDRLQYGSHSFATDVAEQYNVGLGRAFGRNTRLELLYQFGSLRRSLDGDGGSLSDGSSYAAVGQFKVRF